MGRGEDYLDTFVTWFSRLSPNEQNAFMEEHPEPTRWLDFYDRHRR